MTRNLRTDSNKDIDDEKSSSITGADWGPVSTVANGKVDTDCCRAAGADAGLGTAMMVIPIAAVPSVLVNSTSAPCTPRGLSVGG